MGLRVSLTVEAGREAEAASQIRARSTSSQWELVVALAMAVVMEQEMRAAPGTVLLVAPVSRDHLAAVVKAS